MAQEGRFNELDNLFDDGLTMNALPVGVCAGAAAPMLINVGPIPEWLDWLAEKNWRGKIYFSSNNKRVSEGRNRVRLSFVNPRSPIIPMLKFKTMLVDSHPLAPKAKSNIVILNYSDSLTKPHLLEQLVAKVQLIDLMVAVRGKYGPVFVGKTWLGRYDANGDFTASNPDKLIARYFLDFNAGALQEQRESHWDGSEEEVPNPIPHVNN